MAGIHKVRMNCGLLLLLLWGLLPMLLWLGWLQRLLAGFGNEEWFSLG